jgi:hypothetical protein
MNEVDALYQWLAEDRSSEADRILAAALEHAEPAYARRMVATLLQRRTVTAWAGLVANYSRLDAEARQQLVSEPEWLRTGITSALRRNVAQERLNALTALLEHPCMGLSYLVAEGLRAPNAQVRDLAAGVLRRDAEQACAEREDQEKNDRPPSRQAVTERGELVAALREAIRTFKYHEQVHVLEACLWFARDLGGGLWGDLSSVRSQVAHVVTRNLSSWNHPRLAGFLLLALVRPAWRQTALAILGTWTTRTHLIAILRNSDLLADPSFRRELRLLRRPAWFGAAGVSLADLPEAVRARMPQWVCYLGFNNEERVRWLKQWVASSWPDLHCAAVRALATLDTLEATRVLATVAALPGPMEYFARCYVAGKRDSQGEWRGTPTKAAAPSEREPR